MSTFITRTEEPGQGPRLAVKDVIDVAGTRTSLGMRPLPTAAPIAPTDAICVQMMRAGGCRVVGKTNLHELADGGSGINPWYGTPINPQDAARVPGGSSSGSAVAVAVGDADLALGTDTGGSIRIPAACCGVAGLKTTAGFLSLLGVMPLAPTLDTVGPLARTCAGLVDAMRMLEPGFAAARNDQLRIGRLRTEGIDVVESAVNRALAVVSGWSISEIDIDVWDEANDAAMTIMLYEAARSQGHRADFVGADVAARLRRGLEVSDLELGHAHAIRARFRSSLRRVFGEIDLIALPTLPFLAPPLDAVPSTFTDFTRQANLAGVPALSVPVPAHPISASLQLIARWGAEDVLLRAGLSIEQSLRGPRETVSG